MSPSTARLITIVSLASASLAGASLALASETVYDESVDGDLSSQSTAPTVIGTIDTDTLVVRGSVRSGSGGDTRDYLTFTVPDGGTLSAMRLVQYTDGTTGGPGDTGYVMIDDGTTSVVPGSTTSGQFLGGSHLNRTRFPDAETNMLDRLSLGVQGGVGFSLPLGPGAYTVNVQQTGQELNVYEIRFDFEGVSAPCPGDFDGDGAVNGGDLGLFLGSWGTKPCEFDLNGDGACNGADLGVLLGNWGGC